MTALKEVSLETLANGAIPELFAYELDRLIQNIDDPNTDAKARRKITIVVTCAPSENRESAACKVDVRSQLAAVKPAGATLWLSRQGGKLVAMQADPSQTELLFPQVVKGGQDAG